MKFEWPKSLKSFEKAQQRFQAASMNKDRQWRELYRDCYRYALPQSNAFYSFISGERRGHDIFDSTAAEALQEFASKLQALLMPNGRRWCTLIPGADIPRDDAPRVRALLDEVTERLFFYLNHSNFATQIHEVLLDVGIGTGALAVNEGTDEQPFLFRAVSLTDLVIEESNAGQVLNTWYRLKPHAGVLQRLYPGGNFENEYLKKQMERPTEEVVLVHGCVWDDEMRKFYSVVYVEKSGHLLFVSRHETNPWVVARWSVSPSETYGRGVVVMALPDIKTADKVVELNLRNAVIAVSGIWLGRNDGVINPHTARLKPGTVVPVMSNDQKNPSLRGLEFPGNFDITQIILEDLRGSIRRTMLNDERGPEHAIPSATQSAIENQRLMHSSGAAFSRLETEMMLPLISRCLDILSRKGLIPKVKLDGREVGIHFESPLARAQDADDVIGLQQLLGIAAQVPEAGTTVIDSEAALQLLAEKLAVPQHIIRSGQALEEHKAKMMEAAQSLGGLADGNTAPVETPASLAGQTTPGGAPLPAPPAA